MPKIKYTKKDWNTAKKLFIEGIPLSRIEVLTGIPEDYLKQKRSKEGWVALKNKSKEILEASKDGDYKKIEDYIIEGSDRQSSIQLIEEIINIRLQQMRLNINDDNLFLAKDLKSFAQTFVILKDLNNSSVETDEDDDEPNNNTEVEITDEEARKLFSHLLTEQKNA
jgi:hypothetical protein